MVDKYEAFFKEYADDEEQLDFHMGNETIGEKVPVISTGSYVLDDAISAGGLPIGRLIQYYGSYGSGKTLMTMLAIKEAQALDSDAKQVFIDSEGTFDSSWAELIGIDTSRVIIVDGDLAVNGRKCFEMILGTPKEDKKHLLAGKSKEGLLDKIMNQELNVNIIVLDSLGSIIPPGEDTSAVGKMNMSLLARFLTTTFRKLSLDVKKAKIPFICINHKKDNMDPYGVDHTFSGGNTYAHFLSANVYFEGCTGKDKQILNSKEEKIGHVMRATIEKSKFGAYPRKCEFKIVFNQGIIDKHEEIAQLALNYNVVTKSSSVSHEYGELKWVGFPKFCEGLKENPELAQEILNKIIAVRSDKMEQQRQEQLLKKAQVLEENEEKEKKKKGKKTT
jgi:recombination protein RecA